MKKLIKKGQRGITIGNKPLYGYYYPKVNVQSGNIEDDGTHQLADVTVYRPEFYTDVQQNSPELWNYAINRDLSEARIKFANNPLAAEYFATLNQDSKRNLAAAWNVAGRPRIFIDENQKIPTYNGLTGNITISRPDAQVFMEEISHPIEESYFNRNASDSWSHVANLIWNRINRSASTAIQGYDTGSGASPENDEYDQNYKHAPYSNELATHQVIYPIMYQLLHPWGRPQDLRNLTQEQKLLMHDDLRTKKESLQQKYQNIADSGDMQHNKLAQDLADKLANENK